MRMHDLPQDRGLQAYGYSLLSTSVSVQCTEEKEYVLSPVIQTVP
jgi:hypothetical protein